MIAPSTLDKINALPAEVQEQLSLYVDFLFAVYRSDVADENEENFLKQFELTQEGKDFLENRGQLALNRPEKFKSWRAVHDTISQKYNWPKL